MVFGQSGTFPSNFYSEVTILATLLKLLTITATFAHIVIVLFMKSWFDLVAERKLETEKNMLLSWAVFHYDFNKSRNENIVRKSTFWIKNESDLQLNNVSTLIEVIIMLRKFTSAVVYKEQETPL